MQNQQKNSTNGLDPGTVMRLGRWGLLRGTKDTVAGGLKGVLRVTFGVIPAFHQTQLKWGVCHPLI